MKSYLLNNFYPVKVVENVDKGNTVDDNGNGWYNQDLTQLIKISWQKENDKWTAVEGATEQEIAEYQQRLKDEQIEMLDKKWKADGLSYYNKKRKEITNSLIGKPNAIAILSEIRNTVYPILNMIKEGDWAMAVSDYMDNENNPTIQDVIDLFNEVGQKALEYYQNEYPH